MIYLDNAATSYPKPTVVYEAMDNCNRTLAFNVGRGQYDSASQAASIVERTRRQILNFFDCPTGQVIFSPSATSALNMVIQGQPYQEGDVIYISPFEHNAIRRTLNHLAQKIKLHIKFLSVSKMPFTFDLETIKTQFSNDPPAFVFISHASNVCGALAPVKELFLLAKLYGATTILDTAQSAGHVSISMRDILADYLIFAGHKALLGPIGIGGIVMHNKDANLKPTIFGGTGFDSRNPFMPKELPYRLEAGSLNIVAIAGLSASLQWISEIGIETIVAHESEMLNRIQMILDDSGVFSCLGVNYLGDRVGVLSCISEEYLPDELGLILNKNSICVRTGLHCSPDAHRFFNTFPSGAIRFSVGIFTSKEDIDQLASVIQEM
ncbi:MAG: aminotransferase class V-fold PLP-dependent enzyme [Crenarchaeota archaeon]|jgi:cysteine desulfurase family protein|nr:aminotransferase class V-fold PLP-dependent enzyme [Thermoproteota archaeon]